MKRISLTYFLIFLSSVLFAQSYFPAEGEWYKLEISENGVYKIDQAWLKKFGLNANSLNPENFRFFISPEKILPQSNADFRNTALQEIPVYTNNTDRKFDKNDYLLFYAENPHQIDYEFEQFHFQQNPYSNVSFVFMQIGTQVSKKIAFKSQAAQNATEINALTHFEAYAPESVNLLDSGREWYGEYLFSELKRDFKFEGRLTSEPLVFNARFISQTYENTSLEILANDNLIGELSMPLIYYRWNDAYRRYNRAGEITQNAYLVESEKQDISFNFRLPADIEISSGAYLDQLEFTYPREIRFYTQQSQEYLIGEKPIHFQVNSSPDQFVWYIKNLTEQLQIKASSDEMYFFSPDSSLSKLAFFSLNNTYSVQAIEKIETTALSEISPPDLLIIYPNFFKKEAELLAEFRKTHDKLDVKTVEINQIYNEYSGGKIDPSAIRDFCRTLWLKDKKLKYLLLFGDTNFDFKNNNQLDYVYPERLIPTYESFESLEPIYSYSSDDYFGFLEDHEGSWPEGYSISGSWQSTKNRDHSLDISVGRLPVKTKLEAQNLVGKLIYYADSKQNLGPWKRKITFVADDGDLNIHQKDAEYFADLVEKLNPEVQVNKIYIDEYPQIKTDLGERVPKANEAYEKMMREGSLIVNYTGHGAENGWTDEKLLTIDQMVNWRNIGRLPIFFTATCQFGRYDNPSLVSGAELSLLNPDGGAIALLTTTRPVFSSTNFKINQAFYTHLFEDSTGLIRLGDVFRKTKNNSIDGEVNRNFSLLGDPSMALTFPSSKVVLDSINAEIPSQSTIKGRSEVHIKGHVEPIDLNGKVAISLFDKPIEKSTLGNGTNSKMNFKQVSNKLFEGIATVNNGKFEAQFRIPKLADSTLAKGYFYFYAVNSDSTFDAIGGNNDFWLGGISQEPISDIDPPKVSFYYDQGNSTLNFFVTDESGINISSDGGIILTINDSLEVVLNEYYQALNSFKEGEIIFPVSNLSANFSYKLVLKIADLNNNQKIATFSFTIRPNAFKIESEHIYPNPVDDIFNISITQNRIGEDLNFNLSFYDQNGKKVSEESKDCYSCPKNVKFGTNLDTILNTKGKYYYKIIGKSIDKAEMATLSGALLFWK